MPTVAALMHIYPRMASDFNWGGCFGLSISNGTEVTYYLGTSLIFGRKQRFIVSFGPACGKMQIYDDRFKLGENYPIDQQPEALKMHEIYVIRPFIGFTFNLSSLTREKQFTNQKGENQ